MTTEAYPLQWPAGWPRSKSNERAAFKMDRSSATYRLLEELRKMGADRVVISSNLATYMKGGVAIPYADQKIADPGIAVYFFRKGKQQCIPCDRWNNADANIRAIGLTIAALRGIERWGAKQMVDAAFTGFKALPGPTVTAVRYFEGCDVSALRTKYAELAKKLHPDAGGSAEEFGEMKRQYDEILNGGAV